LWGKGRKSSFRGEVKKGGALQGAGGGKCEAKIVHHLKQGCGTGIFQKGPARIVQTDEIEKRQGKKERVGVKKKYLTISDVGRSQRKGKCAKGGPKGI